MDSIAKSILNKYQIVFSISLERLQYILEKLKRVLKLNVKISGKRSEGVGIISLFNITSSHFNQDVEGMILNESSAHYGKTSHWVLWVWQSWNNQGVFPQCTNSTNEKKKKVVRPKKVLYLYLYLAKTRTTIRSQKQLHSTCIMNDKYMKRDGTG